MTRKILIVPLFFIVLIVLTIFLGLRSPYSPCVEIQNSTQRDRCYAIAHFDNINDKIGMCGKIENDYYQSRCYGSVVADVLINSTKDGKLNVDQLNLNELMNLCEAIRSTHQRINCEVMLIRSAARINLTRALSLCNISSINRFYGLPACKESAYPTGVLQVVQENLTKAIEMCKEINAIDYGNECYLNIVPTVAENDLNKAIDICQGINPDDRDLRYHAIIMVKGTNLETALEVCNKIPDPSDKEHCIKIAKDYFREKS